MTDDNSKLANGNFLRIDALWAWISSDDDGEGIIGWAGMPLIGADRARIESYREFAQAAADVSERTIRLVRFDQRVEIETLAP